MASRTSLAADMTPGSRWQLDQGGTLHAVTRQLPGHTPRSPPLGCTTREAPSAAAAERESAAPPCCPNGGG